MADAAVHRTASDMARTAAPAAPKPVAQKNAAASGTVKVTPYPSCPAGRLTRAHRLQRTSRSHWSRSVAAPRTLPSTQGLTLTRLPSAATRLPSW